MNSHEPLRPGDQFQIGPAQYAVDADGVIHQQPPYELKHYDVGYVSERYDTIPDSVLKLSYARAGFILGVCGEIRNVLDVGYGNGGFLRAMQSAGVECAGSDISGYPLPPGCRWVAPEDLPARDWDLITFYDSLEHFPSLDFLRSLRAEYVAITAPCVREGASVDWLAGWKHLRPGEHLHHFTVTAAQRMMARLGYRLGQVGYVEDMIRTPRAFERNIFTAVFHREQY